MDDEEVEGEKPESFSLSLSVYDIAVVVNTSSATVFIMDDEDGTWEFTVFCCFLVALFPGPYPSSRRLLQVTETWARAWEQG